MKTRVSPADGMRGTLDDVAFRSRYGVCEAIGRQRRDVDERLGTENEVADDLAHGGALQEPMPAEARRVEEARDLGGLADECVVVRRHLVVALPTARDAHVEQRREA